MRHLCTSAIVSVLMVGTIYGWENKKYDEVGIGPAVFQIPSSWQRERPSNEMRAVQYGVPAADGDQARVQFVVFYFGGGGGSVQDNLDRWVGMFEKKDGEEKIERFEADGMKVTTLDVAGTYKDKPAPFLPNFELRKDWRMLAAVVETSDGPYFFRIVGPKKTIKEQEENWMHLLKTAKKK